MAKLDVKGIANSLAIVTGIVYIICIVLLWISPSFAVIAGNYLFHGIELQDITVARGIGFSIISLILGVIVTWVLGYGFAAIYNKYAK